ncbi:MAG: argininosuccinate lyase [Bacteroidetes bacterium]|nr:argininosuccinate lyase [Rhodothermia bacterium]MCS7154499.1 argininosuccinate lyase [Bacteroidota bacterium]MCX7906872.1 argininosuccinate lyase [Bacteroidota bacterium]MDW8136849.1 argininosuccinate lyase [Bacteroidota bacterium]MDW8285281.1 argininosuccinate lyase [Bacteroidota bacterium]
MKLLWEKDVPPAEWVQRFTVGEDHRWDTWLLPYDIEGTRAHAWALEQMGVLSAEERASIERVLEELAQQAISGALVVRPEDEDAHTVIERALVKALGPVGEKIQAGRSRNDQVLVAIRLFAREHLVRIGRLLVSLIEPLLELGDKHADWLMPGYTHLQRAMPSTLGLWALGYAELLLDDLEGLRQAHDRINSSPWGSAAGYGVPYLAMPRDAVAERLGFRRVPEAVTSVQLSRGKLEAWVVHALVQLGATLNRLASDLVLFSSQEFGFVELPAAYTTGSSLMPQKRNPDVLELVRASYHRLTAELSLLLSLPANLPSGYHRDLQLTKEALLRALLLAPELLEAVRRTLEGARFRRDRLEAACTPELFATAAALERVRAGVPFRTAYREVGRALDTLRRPTKEQVLAAYQAAGYPGQTRSDGLRNRLIAHRDWLGFGPTA